MQTSSESKLSSTKCSIPASLSSSKQKSRSIRLTIDLNMPEKLPYPHFSLKKLILDQQKRTKSTKKQDPKRTPNPFGDEDSDEEVAKLAAKFEKKYGSFDADGYIDKGEGYDENDPFVDNSEAYDELIPHNITTEFGGFYINCGELKFKSVDEDEVEDELEKASLLQKLKRKRNKIDDDDEDDAIRIDHSKKKPSKSTKPIKPAKSTKESNSNKKTSHPICDDNNAGMVDVKPKKQVAQESKIKDTNKMTNVKLSQANLQNPDHPKPRKSKNTIHPESHNSSSMKKNNPLQQQPSVISNSTLSANAAAATLAQNLYTTKIQQMITDSLLGNLPNSSGTNGNGSNSNASSHFMPQTSLATVTSSIQYQHLHGLKANLLNLKTPYDIVAAIPAIKPINKDGLMSTEWNRYLTDLYSKTSSTKNRNKIYECFTKYINSFGVNISQESLSFYAKQLLLENRNRPMSGSPPTKSSNSIKSSTASALSSTNRSALNSVSSNNSGYQTKNNNNPPSPVQQAINLSTNSSSNQSSFSEGLAGKLMINNSQQNDSNSNLSSASLVTSRASPITSNNFKSNAKTMNISLNKMKPDSYGISTQGLAMLQSLACLASTSSTSTSNASGQHQQKSPSITTTTSMLPPPTISSIQQQQQQQQQQQSSLNRSTTPPTLPRSTSVPNPNSLLAAFTGTSLGGNSKSTSNCNSSSTIKQSASITPPSSSSPTTSTPHTLCSFFPVIPNMFNNANLISHLLNTSPSSSSSSPGAIRQQQQQQQATTLSNNNNTNKQQTNQISTSSTAPYLIHKNSLLLNSNNNVVGSNSNSTGSNKSQSFNASSLIASSQSLASSATGNLLTSQTPTTISSMNRSTNQTSSHSTKQSVINFNKQQPSTVAQQSANCGLQIGLPNQNTGNR